MGLLLLAAARGSVITISAEGTDEADAVAVLRALVERGFDEVPLDAASDGARGGVPCD
jgi:phosphotransferase system HPr-like phosphotransfer protein